VNVRSTTPEDLEAIAELLAADETELLGRPSRISVGDVRDWIGHADPEQGTWLYCDGDRPVAVGWCALAPGSDAAFGVGVVRPGWKGRGLGAELVGRAEACAAALGAGRLHQFTLGGDEAAERLLLARGYRDVRRFYEMAIELAAPPEVPDVPIETFREEDAAAFYGAIDEAFQDHWEHHTTPFEQWWERHRSNPGYDPTLWFLIRDGDEIAAASRNEANRNGGGYVAVIGVRRPWRGKGYAKALLLHTFREFYDRGTRRVTLGVDAENPTGATHLYERVGMHVEQENAVFEKSLP